MKKIGRYDVIAELGRGAMGVVYRASDPTIGREVALKVLSLNVTPEKGTISPQQMFMREIRAAGRLTHPSIVAIHDAFEDAESQSSYIVMEMVPGVTLEKILEATPPPTVEQTLDLLRQVAEGLDYAHRNQVIHRDLKPANILVTLDGRAKITDFGIAKVLAREGVSRTVGIMGTPSYMSPEQVKGGEIDARADLFSFGVILYMMLVGKKPFAGNTAAVMFKIVFEEPPPASTINPQLTPAYDYVVKRCLAKDVNKRYASARELLNDLDDLQHGRPPRSQSAVAAPAPVATPTPIAAPKPAPPPATPPRPGPAQRIERTSSMPAAGPPKPASAPPPRTTTPPAGAPPTRPQTPSLFGQGKAAGPATPAPPTSGTLLMHTTGITRPVAPPAPPRPAGPPATPPVPPPPRVAPPAAPTPPAGAPLVGQTLLMRVPDLSGVMPAPPSPIPPGRPVAPSTAPPAPAVPPTGNATMIGSGFSRDTSGLSPLPPKPAPPTTTAAKVPTVQPAAAQPLPPAFGGATMIGRAFPAEPPSVSPPPPRVAMPPAAQAAAEPTVHSTAPFPVEAGTRSEGAMPRHKSILMPVVLSAAAVVLLIAAGLIYWGIRSARSTTPTPVQVVTQNSHATAPPVAPAVEPQTLPQNTPTTAQQTPPVSPAATATKKPIIRKPKPEVTTEPAAPEPVTPTPQPVAPPPPQPVAPTPSPAEIAKAEAAKLAAIPRVVQVLCNYGMKEGTLIFSIAGKPVFEVALKGKKIKGGFLGIKGSYQGTLTRTVTVPPGASEISLRVLAKDGASDLTKNIDMPPPGGFVPTLFVEVDNEHLNVNWKNLPIIH